MMQISPAQNEKKIFHSEAGVKLQKKKVQGVLLIAYVWKIAEKDTITASFRTRFTVEINRPHEY